MYLRRVLHSYYFESIIKQRNMERTFVEVSEWNGVPISDHSPCGSAYKLILLFFCYEIFMTFLMEFGIFECLLSIQLRNYYFSFSSNRTPKEQQALLIGLAHFFFFIKIIR